MSAMEQSLRRALEAGDASDPGFRETIYSAAERALERMLAAKETSVEDAHAQRVRLAETINRVEEDYFIPLAEDDPSEASVEAGEASGTSGEDGETDPVVHRTDEGGDDADHAPGRELHPRVGGEHELSDGRAARGASSRPDADDLGSGDASNDDRKAPTQAHKADDAAWSPGGIPRGDAKAGCGRPFLFGTIVLLAALIAGLVFAYVTILAPSPGPASDAAPSAAPGASSGAEAADVAWITLFDGTQLEMISTPTGGEVSAIAGAGDRPAVRLAAIGADGEVDVTIGPGVVNDIKGQKVRVEVTVGSPDGTAREFSIRCLFGSDTVCGRQRFSTVQDGESFVFDMSVPSDPSASGTIAINPSFGAGAKTIDLYAVRLRSVEGA